MENKYIRNRKTGELFCYNPNAEFNGNIRFKKQKSKRIKCNA